jgi:hypothetical protein
MELDLTSTRLEIPTDKIFKEVDLVSFLNENSDSITNMIGKPVTTWLFENDQGIDVFAKFQELTKGKEIPYRFLSNKANSLIFEEI